jgi:putative transposase
VEDWLSREQRFQKWVNHNLSKQLVEEAKQSGAAIAFEDLTNIRHSLNQKPRNKVERRRTNSWAFYRLRLFTGYQAAIVGVPIVLVSPAYTSQTCHNCLHIGERSNKSFRCPNCGFSGDADHNAALVISLLGAALVNQPEADCLTNLLLLAVETAAIRAKSAFADSKIIFNPRRRVLPL